MAQLVARLVRNEKVGGSNPPSSTTDRHPIRMSVFCMPGYVVAVLVAVLLVVPLVFRALEGPLWGRAVQCAHGRRPAREPSAPRAFGSARRLVVRPGPAAAHSTAAMPSGPSGVLHTGNAWSADVRLGASPRSTARPRRRPTALRPCPLAPSGTLHTGGALGYRTKRVGLMVTFQLFGAEKSVLKLVGANLKDGLNVLVL